MTISCFYFILLTTTQCQITYIIQIFNSKQLAKANQIAAFVAESGVEHRNTTCNVQKYSQTFYFGTKEGFQVIPFTKVQLCDFNFWGFRFQVNYWRISHVSRVGVNTVIRTDVLSVEIFFKLKSICPYKNKIITIIRPKMV